MTPIVSRKTKIGFGAGEFSSSIFFTITSFWLMNFLTDEVRLSAALAGSALLVGKIWDVIIDPFILGWHSKNFHVTTGIDIYIPVGSYNQDRLANTGRNYWTFEPIVAFTYLSDGGFEISAKFMYDFNTENDDTKVQSGQEFHVDYAVGYHIGKEWIVGLNGYYYQQVTEDEQNGNDVGNKGRVFAIGPAVQYNYKNMSFTAKWQPEFEARNKPEGNKFWFNFVYAF